MVEPESLHVAAAICRTCNDEELAAAPYIADEHGETHHETTGLVSLAARGHLARHADHDVRFTIDTAESDAVWKSVVKARDDDQATRDAVRGAELTRQAIASRLAYEAEVERRQEAGDEQAARAAVRRRFRRR